MRSSAATENKKRSSKKLRSLRSAEKWNLSKTELRRSAKPRSEKRRLQQLKQQRKLIITSKKLRKAKSQEQLLSKRDQPLLQSNRQLLVKQQRQASSLPQSRNSHHQSKQTPRAGPIHNRARWRLP